MNRVTMNEIAGLAGVSVMTVSLVLRDKGRISESTRNKIKTLASDLGYVPDPALSALIYHRKERRAFKENATLAFLTSFDTYDGWKNEYYIARYYDGVIERATQLGYRVEPFWLKAPGMTPERMTRILETRSIQGLLVAPIKEKSIRMEFPWSRFCAVSLCRNLVWPRINVVDHNHHLSMYQAWDELTKRGYRKIGYAITELSEEIAGYQWLGSHLIQQRVYRNKVDSLIPALVTDNWTFESFRQWYQTHKPDVVISPDLKSLQWIKMMGIKLPEECGFLHLEASPNGKITGIWQNFTHVGITAVDLLHLEIVRLELGVPPIRQSISIDGTWLEGETLRPLI